NPAVNNDEIAIIGKRHGVRDVYLNEEIYGKGAKLKVPELDELAEHIARKTNIDYTLKEQYEEDLQQNAQMELFTELEVPLEYILAEIEHHGVKVDLDRLKEMGK